MPYLSGGDRRIFLAIVLIALALRVAYVLDTSDSPYFDYPTLDAFWYDAKAQDVLDGDLLVSTGTFRVPLYIYFVAGVYTVFGRSFLALALIQAILGALACGILFMLGKRLFGTAAGVVAGLGFGLYSMAVYGVGEILPVTLYILLLLGGAYFLVISLSGAGLRASVGAGVCLGLAFLTHPDTVPFALLVCLVAALLFSKKRGMRVAVTVGGVMICLMLLQGFRNYIVFKQFFVFSPQGAVNLYIGNAQYADGKTPVAPATFHPYDIGTDPSQDSITLGCRQAAFEDVGRYLSDRELSSYYLRRTLEEIRDGPTAWLALMGRKAYYFLNSYERSDIKLIPRIRDEYSAVLRLPLLSFAVPVSLGLVGLTLVLKRRRRLGLFPVAGVVAYAFNSVVFFVVWRYRLPAVPFLMLLGGLTVSELWWAVCKRNTRLIIGVAAGVTVLSLVSASRFWDVGREDWASQYLINEAALHLKAGNYEKAVEVYQEAAAADPLNARVYFYLGRAHAAEGQIEESKEMMEKASRLNPAYEPYSLLSLGVALANQGRYENAADYFARALTADKDLGLAAFNLGISLLNLGRTEDAERAFSRAENLCKDDTGTLVAIAAAYVRMGQNRRGISLAGSVLEKEPRNADALYAVGLGLEADGRTDEALEHFRAALRYEPDSAEIMRKIRSLRSRGVSP